MDNLFTKFEYKQQHTEYKTCWSHVGRPVDYVMLSKAEGGRFDYGTDSYGICEECYNALPSVDVIAEIQATKKRFRQLIRFLQQPGHEDKDYQRFQIDAYKTRLTLLRQRMHHD